MSGELRTTGWNVRCRRPGRLRPVPRGKAAVLAPLARNGHLAKLAPLYPLTSDPVRYLRLRLAVMRSESRVSPSVRASTPFLMGIPLMPLRIHCTRSDKSSSSRLRGQSSFAPHWCLWSVWAHLNRNARSDRASVAKGSRDGHSSQRLKTVKYSATL